MRARSVDLESELDPYGTNSENACRVLPARLLENILTLVQFYQSTPNALPVYTMDCHTLTFVLWIGMFESWILLRIK